MTEIVIDLITRGGYLGILLLMALENIVPPIPSELIMGLGGIAVARGHMAIAPLLIAGTIGSSLGNLFWYELGRRVGYQRFRPLIERYGRWTAIEWRDVEKIHTFFLRHGHWVIFVVRFMPAFRTIISLPAGMTRMPRWKFLVWTAAGTLIWNCILVGAGYYLGTSFSAVDAYIGPATVVMIVGIVALYVWRVASWKPRG